MLWPWIADAFEKLPGCSDLLFQNLWKERRLRFQGSGNSLDDIDVYSARLVSGCLSVVPRSRLLIVLPDSDVHRPATLLATAILRHWGHSLKRSSNTERDTILYFGSTIGIREHLRQTTVQGLGLNLADVFRQQDVSARSGMQNQTFRSVSEKTPQTSTLPRVKTIYAPADPGFVIEQEKPVLVAIDLGDSPHLPWLAPLMDSVSRIDIPVIAWGHNPLSECVKVFAEKGSVFSWPMPLALPVGPSGNGKRKLEACFLPSITTHVQPLLMEGEAVGTLDSSLRSATKFLIQGASRSCGQLGSDAIRLHWSYLRTLERLCVPVDFYESEAPRIWGIRSFAHLRLASERFRDACEESYPELASDLHSAASLLDSALESMRTLEPPLWRALCSLSIEEPPLGEIRIITFLSQARKQLFLFSLLAKFNVTEEDLLGLRIRVVNLKQASTLMKSGVHLQESFEFEPALDRDLTWRIQLVGVPSPLASAGVLTLLLEQNLEVLLYPHQLSALQRLASDWRWKLGPDFYHVTGILAKYSGLQPPQEKPPANKRLNMNAILSINTGSAKTAKKLRSSGSLWEPSDAADEISRLLDSDSEDESVQDVISAGDTATRSDASTPSEVRAWCDTAVRVRFQEGWQVRFAPEETINVVLQTGQGQKTDERHVSSLRNGDRVVLIQGQQRQSLYDLIISRVHRNPAFELHLALIRRWQEDLGSAFQRWRQHGVRNLDELLNSMQQIGSNLTSSFTLRLWLWGRILCPDDVEDLRRIAEVLDMTFVGQHYKRIGAAASRLRGLHRGLSNRLNHWLERQATGVSEIDWDDQIDRELGLNFADFRNSLITLRVSAVQVVTGPFLLSSLGKLEKET